MTDKAKPVTVKTTLYWVERNKLNKYSNKYQVVLGNLSEKAVEALDAMGVPAKNKGDEKGYFITCKSNNPIKIIDESGSEIDGDVLISNGSKGTAVVGYYDWKIGEGRSPTLLKLKVTELIEYVDGGGFDDDDAL